MINLFLDNEEDDESSQGSDYESSAEDTLTNNSADSDEQPPPAAENPMKLFDKTLPVTHSYLGSNEQSDILVAPSTSNDDDLSIPSNQISAY